jgi:hypothetical protein
MSTERSYGHVDEPNWLFKHRLTQFVMKLVKRSRSTIEFEAAEVEPVAGEFLLPGPVRLSFAWRI